MTLLTAEELQAIRDRSTFVPDGTVSAWMRYAAPAPEDRAALLAHIDAFSAPQGLTAADIITILRANPCAALEAVREAKIAGPRQDFAGTGTARECTEISCVGWTGLPPKKTGEEQDAALRAANWILVDA